MGRAVRLPHYLAMLPYLSWLEREAVNLKVGSSSLPGSGYLGAACREWDGRVHSGKNAVAVGPGDRMAQGMHRRHMSAMSA